MTQKKATRVERLEQLLDLVVRDMNSFQQHVNFLGQTLQATINVLGQGAVSEELKRMASPEPTQAPPSEEEKAAAFEAGIHSSLPSIEAHIEPDGQVVVDALVPAQEEPGADQAEDRPAESP